jgi:hypothetical protein
LNLALAVAGCRGPDHYRSMSILCSTFLYIIVGASIRYSYVIFINLVLVYMIYDFVLYSIWIWNLDLLVWFVAGFQVMSCAGRIWFWKETTKDLGAYVFGKKRQVHRCPIVGGQKFRQTKMTYWKSDWNKKNHINFAF